MKLENNNTESWKLPLYKIFSDEEDEKIVTNVIKRGSQWAIGPEIEEFENEIKNYVGKDYCVVLNSGTSSLHALFLAYGLSNQEIIVPSFSFIATANAVLFVNGKPIFADIEESTYGLDPKSVKEKYNPSVKAIVPIDYAGLSCKIHELKDFAKENNCILIEDAAEALGSTVNGSKVGSIADSSVFSFCGNKVLTTGEGGAIVTDSKEIFEKLKLIRSHGRINDKNYFSNPSESDYASLGYNWRMSTITAALGLSQLRKIGKMINLRKQNAKYISERLSKHPQIKVPTSTTNSEHIFQLYTIRLSDNVLRDKLHGFLTKKQIFSKVYFNPIHLTDFYKKIQNTISKLPNTELVSKQVLTLPMYPNMTKEEKDYLVESIDEFFENTK